VYENKVLMKTFGPKKDEIVSSSGQNIPRKINRKRKLLVANLFESRRLENQEGDWKK
jgi:hypothetical protein